jgi:hypothetical protein
MLQETKDIQNVIELYILTTYRYLSTGYVLTIDDNLSTRRDNNIKTNNKLISNQ